MTNAALLSLPSSHATRACLEATALRVDKGEMNATDYYWINPSLLLEKAGLKPDRWQSLLLRCNFSRTLLLTCRQAGKSTVSAGLAVLTAILEPPALILLLSPSLRQSGEIFRKAKDLVHAQGKIISIARETALTLELSNGSRIVSLPGTEETIRGYSGVRLLIVDEAARVSDDLFRAVTPMLAVSGGRMVALSTPFGKRGWFWEEWSSKGDWKRFRVTATQCPRIPADFLDEERRSMGPRWFAQEYICSFEDATDAVFTYDVIHRGISRDIKPIVLG